MLMHVGIYAFVTLFSLVSTIYCVSESYVLSTGPTKRIFVAVTFETRSVSSPGSLDSTMRGEGKKVTLENRITGDAKV